jgi:thymidylate kinase
MSPGDGCRERMVAQTCQTLDLALSARALVFGSLPPHGRDLDLLARPQQERECVEALQRAGFARRGRRFARFGCGCAYEVELFSSDCLGLADDVLEDLFAQAKPLDGCRQLVRPAPHHLLLLLSGFVLSDPGALDDKRRRAVQRALAEDSRAWERAAAQASRWPRADALVRLRRSFERHARPRLRPPRPRPRLGVLVALSGIDGSGKSSHAHWLAQTLEQLGYRTAVEWVPLASNRALELVGGPLKRLVCLCLGARPPVGAPTAAGDRGPSAASAGELLRARSALATELWASYVALLNALAHLRRAVPHLLAGRIVIFDRYVLDSLVHLHLFYGEQRAFRLQRLAIKTLSPRAAHAFWLDVSAPTSLQRKDDGWTSGELQRKVRLYRREYALVGVTRLDGERSPEALCAQIAQAVWRSLP